MSYKNFLHKQNSYKTLTTATLAEMKSNELQIAYILHIFVISSKFPFLSLQNLNAAKIVIRYPRKTEHLEEPVTIWMSVS